MKNSSVMLLTALIPLTFFSCTKNNSLPSLDISFSSWENAHTEKVSLSFLTSVIGTGSGKTESFGEQKDMLIFFTEDDCFTCSKVRPAINEWIKESHAAIYEYTDSPEQGTEEERRQMLKKLGSPDGTELTAGRLIAFVNGKRAAGIAGTFDLESTEKINSFAERFYNLPSSSSLSVKTAKEFNSLKELRTACAQTDITGENFITLFERHSCPDCRSLSDPKRSNVITEVFKTYRGTFCKIVTENTVSELELPVKVDGKKYSSTYDFFTQQDPSKETWLSDSNKKKIAEYTAIITACRFIPAYENDDEMYLKAVIDFAKDEKLSENGIKWSYRWVPAFTITTKSDIKPDLNSKAHGILFNLYSAQNDKNLEQKSQITNFFAPDNNHFSRNEYTDALLHWIISW